MADEADYAGMMAWAEMAIADDPDDLDWVFSQIVWYKKRGKKKKIS